MTTYYFLLYLNMKNLYSLIIYLFISFFSLAQEKEYSSQNAFLKGKKYIMDSVYGDPGINIQKIYIDGLPGNGWNELTTIYYNGEEKEGIVLGFFDQVSNEFGLRYYQNIYKNFDRDEAISFFRTLDLIKDRERDYLNDENGENNVYFKIGDLSFLLYLSGGYQIVVFWDKYVSNWGGPSFEKMRRKFERRLRQSDKGKIND